MLPLRSLIHYRRLHVAVAIGVAVATAVLTGALLVGDSVRGSLRALVLDRLGRIDQILVTDRFFRTKLVDEFRERLDADPRLKAGFAELAPGIVMPSAAVESVGERRRRAADVTVLGVDDAFWKLSTTGPMVERSPKSSEIVLNEPLASELGVSVGDVVTLRLPTAESVPADSPLARKDKLTASVVELKVIAIVPAEGLGRFALRPNQSIPRNAYVATKTIQQAIDQRDRINALFVAGANPDLAAPKELDEALRDALSPSLDDLNLTLKRVTRKYADANAANSGERTIFDYYSLSTDRLVLEPELIAAAETAWKAWSPQRVSTNVAIEMKRLTADGTADADAKSVAYSLVTALSPHPTLGPYDLASALGADRPLADDEILVTRWMAEDQNLSVGDRVRIRRFQAEGDHKTRYPEATEDFRVAGIVPLTEPKTGYSRRGAGNYDQPPERTNDPDLTPVVRGITNQQTISDWDAPFPVDTRLVRPKDDDFWDKHRTTPKAYLSEGAALKLWNSRWGVWTGLRVPAGDDVDEAKLTATLIAELKRQGTTLGFDFRPVKRQGLAAASGTTPFDGLFLGLSMFLIGAALLLIALLFRLGVERRATEVGVMAAIGWPRRMISRALLTEGLLVASVGAIVGVALGVGYAWIMLAGLRSWWIGAVSSPFLQLHITGKSLALGWFCGVIASGLTIAWSLRAITRSSPRALLAGAISSGETESAGARATGTSRAWLIAGGLALAAAALAAFATTLGGEAQAGAFLGCGSLVLAALAIVVRNLLARGAGVLSLVGSASLSRLAARNAGRNPARSLMTTLLVAMSVFLLVAIGAFRLDPNERGGGGFDWVGESSTPLVEPLVEGEKPGFASARFKLKPGDDASCRNLYKATQPRVLGAPDDLAALYESDPSFAGFDFAAHAPLATQGSSPWRLLASDDPTPTTPTPCFLDKNTAMYSLQLYGGVGQTFDVTFPDGRKVAFRVAGLLSNSVLQGSIVIGEKPFKRLFPDVAGERFFLVRGARPGDAQAPTSEKTAGDLEERWSDFGLDLRRTRDVLTDLLAVQNTYISTFQTLGGFGLLLGTFGLAAAQLRSVFERRGELALLRAIGFGKERVANMVLLENVVLLIVGLAMGAGAALVAVLPHMLLGGARPPWTLLGGLLAAVLVAGALTARFAMRATLQAPVVGALRGE